MATTATRILRKRIVLIFDFDGTLGPNATRAYFEHLDLLFPDFQARLEKRKKNMWQAPLAKADLLRKYSHRLDSPISRRSMDDFGGEVPALPRRG